MGKKLNVVECIAKEDRELRLNETEERNAIQIETLSKTTFEVATKLANNGHNEFPTKYNNWMI